MQRRITKAGVIGSGIMGGGIAALLASAGIKTVLLDIVPFDLSDDEKNDPKARNRIVEKGLKDAINSKPPLFMDKKSDPALVTTGNLEDDINELADCDWIVEVVVEKLEIKQDLFKKVDKVRKKGTVVSSNTSGIPLKDMSKELSDDMKQHFLGTHFFNPVRYMHLLEIIPGPDTKKDVLEFMADFCEKYLGKGIVWAKDTPNFIGNRIGIQGMGKAMHAMLEHGLTIPEVDAIFGQPMGRPKTATFKTADLVGLDTMYHVAKNCYDMCPEDEMRDTMALPSFVGKMVENNMLGNKTKGGFYKKELTEEWKTIRKVINPETLEYEEYGKADFPCLQEAKKKSSLPEKMQAIVYGDDKGAKFAWDVIADSLIYAANRLPEISDTIVDIDNAMKWGYNFEMGPFEAWEAIGVKKSVERMEKEGRKVPEKIKKFVDAGNETFYKIEGGKKYFYDFASGSYKPVPVSDKEISLYNLRQENKVVKSVPSCSLIDLGDGVFNIEFHTKMNAVNREMIEFMIESHEYVSENGVGVVIGNQASGMPAPFSAGGDLAFMLGLAKEGKFSEIDDFIKTVHQSILGSKYAPYPVVAAPFGLALGGGAEVCLASDRMVANADLFMGLVEVGAGLVPGGAGMMHLWQNYIRYKPQVAKITDYSGFFIQAFMQVAQAKVSGSAAEARNAGFLRPADRIVFNKDLLIGEAKKEVLKMVDDCYVPPRKDKFPVFGREGQGMIWSEMLNMKTGGYITPHMETIAKRACYCMAGGDVPQGTQVSEEYLMKLEREAFVDLWKTEETQKMAEHMMNTGKPLFL
ncbi:MAG: 3-hydroxyacyl-CoA dehydrogenase NAD-binding domain-containing protein [Thermodesulfobacteriota bacterium]